MHETLASINSYQADPTVVERYEEEVRGPLVPIKEQVGYPGQAWLTSNWQGLAAGAGVIFLVYILFLSKRKG